jgi:PAS domain S-box-containing protein
MQEQETANLSLPLDQQINSLSHLADQILSQFQALKTTTPEAVQGLHRLVGVLARISRQVAQLEEERQDLLALADISRVVNSSLELNEVLRIVMDTIIRLTGAERGFLMLSDKDGELTIRIARNWEQESLDASEFAISRTVINRVVSEGRAVLTTNAQEDPRFGGQDSIVAYSLRSILCVPLTDKNDALTGVIYADNRIRTGIFTNAERDLLTAFAHQAAIAIDNARLFESVRQTLAEVTELKNLMDNVFASIVSGVITADIEDTITLCNRAAETILGKSTSEVVGKPLQMVFPPLDGDLARQVESVRQTDRHIVGLEYSPTLPKRGPVILSVNLSPLKDANQATQGVAIVLDDLTEKKHLEALHSLFERMVSPAVIEQLNPEKLQLGGKRTEITTLFADIRGFTTFSEPRDPEELVSVLNRYLGAATNAVLSEEGTLDKFLGDAVMAFFNAPISQPDHTLRAVRAALGLRDAVEALHKTLPPAFHLSFGVGIHFGEAVLGLVGTEKRLDYTAIGDSVNTAKRLQENALPGQILISTEAYVHIARQIEARPISPINAKGKSQPLQVFEVVGLTTEQQDPV